MEPLHLTLNGTQRTLESLAAPVTLEAVLAALSLRGDRIAVELNGTLAPRTSWAGQTVRSGDKLEIVHFVGGGSLSRKPVAFARQSLADSKVPSRLSHRSP